MNITVIKLLLIGLVLLESPHPYYSNSTKSS